MNHLTTRWARVAKQESLPFPRMPLDAKVDHGLIYEKDLWFHYSTTGTIPGPYVHAGTLDAALSRARSLEKYQQTYNPADFHTPPPDHWLPKWGKHGVFVLKLTKPLVWINPGRMLSDEAANTIKPQGPMLYTNNYEDTSNPSLIAPISDLEIVAFSRHDVNFMRISPRPLSQAEDIAKAFNLYFAQYEAWERSLEDDDEPDEDDEDNW